MTEDGSVLSVPLGQSRAEAKARRQRQSLFGMQAVRKMAHYSPQVDDEPPPAYPKGYSVRLQLIRLAARTTVFMVLIIGAFVLLSVYLHTSAPSCSCASEDIASRSDPEPLIAEPSTHQVKLQIGENIREHKGKSHMDCMVERREQSLDAMPPKGNQRLQVKGEEVFISCNTSKGKRIRRSPICDCSCAC